MSQFYVQYGQRGRRVSKGSVRPVYYVLITHPTLGCFRENRETLSEKQVHDWMAEVPVEDPEWTPLDDLQRWQYLMTDEEMKEVQAAAISQASALWGTLEKLEKGS